jgi:hypothetical protein
MKTIVLHTPKGGSGKSTLAREIATMAARSGVSTTLADLDPQGTTGGWYQRRKSADPALVDLGPVPFRAKMDELTKAGLDLLVIGSSGVDGCISSDGMLFIAGAEQVRNFAIWISTRCQWPHPQPVLQDGSSTQPRPAAVPAAQRERPHKVDRPDNRQQMGDDVVPF